MSYRVDVLHSPVSQQQAILMFEVITSLGCAIDNLLYERPVVGMYAPHHRIYCWFNRGIVLEDAIGFVRPDSLSTVRFPTEATCVTEPLCFGQLGFTAAQFGGSFRHLRLKLSLAIA